MSGSTAITILQQSTLWIDRASDLTHEDPTNHVEDNSKLFLRMNSQGDSALLNY
jgi:hypothetical protein